QPLNKLPTSFNARSETLFQKPFFRGAQRCLVPTSGWREFPGPSGKKRAFNFERRTRAPGQSVDHPSFFAFGGIACEWHDRSTGEVAQSFAILTTEPSETVKPYHHRMPLLVAREHYSSWLDVTLPYGEVLDAATRESHAAHLTSYECSTFGNSTRNEGPECIAPVMSQRSLFD